MAGEAQDKNWPLPKFYFMVDWGSTTNIPFQEVSGLDIETQGITYRHGNSPVFSEINMPGIVKNSNVTMKKAVFAKDNGFWDWYSKIKMNTIERQNVVVKLLDEGGNPTMTWTLSNAWPTKIKSTDLKSNGNEVAIESIEIMHEGLTIANG
ncbi:phage tail protein [Aquimarina sp. AD10]|uniref:Phage tail protein n=1 Tax=Aquimarina aggregata TaxID=1642818 RepID=A0A162ZFB8_9FLAO|nr:MULTISPECIES: phage tail protein [Aquimarina]AXT62063.1 phage tail protein [Aquimarina sp. AD10]KZS39762.1 phage tail protein [Aquimarina aggregata]RKM99949.1 phage tail protein [Aquimarina sp. AD10]